MTIPVHVLQVNCARDRRRRHGPALLEAWPTLPAIASAVRGAGAEVTVLQASHKNLEFRQDGVRYQFVAEPRLDRVPAFTLFPWRLARAARACGPDIVHLNGLCFPLHARWLSGLGCPVLIQDHAGGAARRLRLLHRWGLAKISGVTFTANAQADEFFAAGQLPRRVRLFEIAESSTHFRSGDTDAARQALGMHGDPLLLWIGRLNSNKDPLTILDAFSRVLTALPKAQLWCCFQDAPLLGVVMARLAAQPTLAARVHLVGEAPHARIELLCRAADIFVSASRREGSGYALIEAMACGATPVVSDIPAFRALTGNGRVGALAPPGDAAAFAAALLAVCARPAAQRRAETLAHFAAELSFPVIGKRLLAAYRTLIAAQAEQHAGR